MPTTEKIIMKFTVTREIDSKMAMETYNATLDDAYDIIKREYKKKGAYGDYVELGTIQINSIYKKHWTISSAIRDVIGKNKRALSPMEVCKIINDINYGMAAKNGAVAALLHRESKNAKSNIEKASYGRYRSKENKK